MILVTGSTGQLGKTTIEFLLRKMPAKNIAALARDEFKASGLIAKGVDVRVGDYEDPASLISAFKGIDKLFFVSGSDVARRQEQHKNIVNAAKEAGVKHIVYTSFARKNETESNPLGIVAAAHIETDKLIKESGIPYTIMLNGLYADVLPMFFGNKVLDSGIFLPAGEGKAAYITRNDIAEAAANILAGDGHEKKEYVIANTENYSMHDAAEILSDISGKYVSYLNPTVEAYTDTLSKAGVQREYIDMFTSFSEAISQGEFETPVTDMKKLLGRTPASLKDFFTSAYFSKN